MTWKTGNCLITSAASDRRYWEIAMGPWDRLVRQLLERGRERGQTGMRE
jgi:hypothetical protein